jgi:hypothetical protein
MLFVSILNVTLKPNSVSKRLTKTIKKMMTASVQEVPMKVKITTMSI